MLVVDAAAAADATLVVLEQAACTGTGARCAELGISLAQLETDVDWSHLIWLTKDMLNRRQVSMDPVIPLYQGLFAIADAVSAMLDAPVTIEDAHSRVVAYSATLDGADATRTSTIMSRSVPEPITRRLRATGVLKRLSQDNRPFIVPPLESGFLQRVVVPLRLGSQTVGSIWAIWDGELDAQVEAQLVATGAAAALSLVQLNASQDSADRYSVEVIRAALRDASIASSDALALPFRPMRVVALQSISGGTATDDVALWRTFLRKKSWSDPILTDVDGCVFAIVSEHSGPGSWAWLRDQLSVADAPGSAASSRSRSELAELPAARLEAVETLAAVRSLGHAVGAFEEVWDTVVLRRPSAAISSIDYHLLQLLRNKDRENGTHLADTLRTWLEHGCDVRSAAAHLHLHPNTVRHRLKKADELVGDALRTHTRRLATLLLLRSCAETVDIS